jgi:hypothetical protein
MYVNSSNVSTITHTRICYIVCCNAALSQLSKPDSNFSLKTYSKRTRLFAILCQFRQTLLFGRKASADFVQVVMAAEKFGFQGAKLIFDPVKSSLFCSTV